MSTLTEQKVLSQVNILPQQNRINVQWLNQIVKNGEVISSIPHRKAYCQDQAADFAAEVEGAAGYLAAAGWA